MSMQNDPVESTDPGNKTPAEIEAEVEATRSRVSNTLDEVQGRLAPGPLFEELLAFARQRGGTDMARNLARDVRENPLPFLLIGAGVAWLAFGRGRPARPVVREPYVAPLPPADSYADDPYLKDRSTERYDTLATDPTVSPRAPTAPEPDPSDISIALGDTSGTSERRSGL